MVFTTSPSAGDFELHRKAKIYIGNRAGLEECGQLPINQETSVSNVYTFDCDIQGDFIKIESEKSDRRLAIAEVTAYTEGIPWT